MVVAGEDPRFIARRLVILAAEDVGLADPQALVVAQAAADAVSFIGMPEGRIPLGEATAYLAMAPKSNRSYLAIDAAIADVQGGQGGRRPRASAGRALRGSRRHSAMERAISTRTTRHTASRRRSTCPNRSRNLATTTPPSTVTNAH